MRGAREQTIAQAEKVRSARLESPRAVAALGVSTGPYGMTRSSDGSRSGAGFRMATCLCSRSSCRCAWRSRSSA